MKTVGIADLKAKLSEYIRDVRRGEGLVVMDRRTPVARVLPYVGSGDELEIRPPARRYRSMQKVPLPPPLRLDVDVVEVLLQERQGER